MPTFTIRAARENEAATVMEFIKKLAEYEKLAQETHKYSAYPIPGGGAVPRSVFLGVRAICFCRG